ncbi:MAG: hypothetical protein LBH25_03180 [Fibromonadaceae bacterium]|jgi:hypothetical protein|nr:hypothetical protein [Fibromonadaceae bacterium]
MIDIPAELLFPTVEELEERTSMDLAEKWKPSKRPGKKERLAIKRQREAAKISAIANEYNNPKQIIPSNDLSSLFVQSTKPKFSLAEVNASQSSSVSLRPILKVSVEKAMGNGFVTKLLPPKSEVVSVSRKRGRSPKVNQL